MMLCTSLSKDGESSRLYQEEEEEEEEEEDEEWDDEESYESLDESDSDYYEWT